MINKFIRLTAWLTDRSDSFLQLNTKKIIFQASYLLSSHVIGNILSFLVAIAAAHFISKETYGVYRYVLSIVSILGVFSLTGLSTSIIRSVARGYDNMFRTSFVRSLTWSLPTLFLGLGVSLWYFLHGNNIFGSLIILGSIASPVIQSLLLYKSYLNGKKYFRALMKSNIIYSTVTSLTLLIVLSLRPTVSTMVFSYYISNLVVVIILTAIIKKKFPPNDNKDPEEGRLEHHISIMNILDIGATQLDKILLFQIAGPIEVAHYTFATIIPEQLRNIIKYIPTLSMPIFSKLSAQTAKAKSLFLTKKLFLITIPIVLVYITLAPLVYRILFPSYTEVIFYSQIFVLILIFDGGISSTVLKAQNQLKSLYWANATSNIVKVILLISLGYIWGIWGIIISRIMSRILGFLITYVLVKKMATR